MVRIGAAFLCVSLAASVGAEGRGAIETARDLLDRGDRPGAEARLEEAVDLFAVRSQFVSGEVRGVILPGPSSQRARVEFEHTETPPQSLAAYADAEGLVGLLLAAAAKGPVAQPPSDHDVGSRARRLRPDRSRSPARRSCSSSTARGAWWGSWRSMRR